MLNTTPKDQLRTLTAEYRTEAVKLLIYSINNNCLRLGSKSIVSELMINDIFHSYGYLTLDEILEQFKKGGLGQYGTPYKVAPITFYGWLNEFSKGIPGLQAQLNSRQIPEGQKINKEPIKYNAINNNLIG